MIRFPADLWQNRQLWWRLTEREILGRYRGSALGLGWSVLNPLAMLAVYTFVFSQVFKSRWGGLEELGPLGFAVNLFAGLIVFNLFSECASRAPNLIVNNPNYVKKVVFPLEVLGSVAVGNAGFHALTSLAVLLVFELMLFKHIPATILLVDEKEHSIDDFETVENFFIRKENELKDDYLCFGFIKNKKRGFRISRKKQFILNAYSCISKVHNQYGFTKNLQIACTFANKMK